MKIDLIKLVALIWMCVMAYFIYEIYADLKYINELITAYVQMVMQHIRH